MADVLLENTSVFELEPEYSVAELQKKFDKKEARFKNTYNANVVEKHRIQGAYKDLSADSEAFYDYNQEELLDYKNSLEKNQRQIVETAVSNRSEAELLSRYGDSFAYLYQLKERGEKAGEEAKFKFKEIEQRYPAGIMTQEQYYELSANPKGVRKQLALEVELDSENRFSLMMPPYDKPGAENKQVKAQVAFEKNDLQKLNAAKMAAILEFCESYGLSTFQMDVPYSFDGNIDLNEKINNLLREINEKSARQAQEADKREAESQDKRAVVLQQEGAQNGANKLSAQPSTDLPRSQEIIETESVSRAAESAVGPTNPAQPAVRAKPEKTKNDAEKGFEKFLEGGLRKEKNLTYFKTHTGWFGRGWTEYVVYDKADERNMKKDGLRDPKTGEKKFTYNFKLFLKKENGKFRFAYKTPGNKKVDDSVVNGMAGQFKELGITHVRFPDGLQDAEKKLWRIALAENGIVPKGMGLDKAKAEGMLKAAKEKLSTEDFRKFRYRLAVQMDKDNHSKGKVVSPSEQDFIEGIKNSQKYMAFTEGYSNRLKGMLRDQLDKADVNHDRGAVDKTAAYMALRRLFDAYKETVDQGSLLSSSNLTAEEKRRLTQEGLNGPVKDFTDDQMARLYEIMLPQSQKDAKKEMDDALSDARDAGGRTSKGAKRADNVIIKEVFDGARSRFEKINEILTPMGIDELSFPKSFGRLHYDDVYREHPEWRRKAQESAQPMPTPTQAHAVEATPATKAFVQSLSEGRN